MQPTDALILFISTVLEIKPELSVMEAFNLLSLLEVYAIIKPLALLPQRM